MVNTVSYFRGALLAFAGLLLVACAAPDEVYKKPDPLGNFKLGFVVVVADNAQIGPFSRPASADMLEAAIQPELDTLFKGYEGEKFYNIGVSVDAYVLAMPGVPLVASPKSILILGLSIWDDSAQKLLTDPPEQIIVLEEFSGSSILGSGLTKNKETQLAELSKRAAKAIQKWMIENKHLFEPVAAE